MDWAESTPLESRGEILNRFGGYVNYFLANNGQVFGGYVRALYDPEKIPSDIDVMVPDDDFNDMTWDLLESGCKCIVTLDDRYGRSSFENWSDGDATRYSRFVCPRMPKNTVARDSKMDIPWQEFLLPLWLQQMSMKEELVFIDLTNQSGFNLNVRDKDKADVLDLIIRQDDNGEIVTDTMGDRTTVVKAIRNLKQKQYEFLGSKNGVDQSRIDKLHREGHHAKTSNHN